MLIEILRQRRVMLRRRKLMLIEMLRRRKVMRDKNLQPTVDI